jgi:hypothetical protein
MGILAIKTLMQIQNELKAPKNQYNSFGKYKYRNCEDILEALKPICNKYNSAIILSDDLVPIGERYYVKATATLYCFNENKEKFSAEFDTISSEAYAREELDKKGMDGSQVTGASSSYARKYALNGLFGIDDTKDSDSTNEGGKTENKVAKTNDKTVTEQVQANPIQAPKTVSNEVIAPQINMSYDEALNYMIDCKLHFGKTLKDVYKTDRQSIQNIYNMGSTKLKRAIEIIEAEILKSKKQ